MSMNVFISWSGELSRMVADALHKHLPCMLQDVHAFMSTHNIESGSRWGQALAQQLEESHFGIICLTPENMSESWLVFEAGALTKHADGRACALLLGDLTPTDVAAPLAQFQNMPFTRADFKALVKDINHNLSSPLETEQLDLVFEQWWPALEKEYNEILKKAPGADNTEPHRGERDVLDEVLTKVRAIGENLDDLKSRYFGDTSDILTASVTYDSLSRYTRWKFPDLPISQRWQFDLLNDLNLRRFPTIRQIDEAVNAASEAVNAYRIDAPDLFRHGTDFITKSLGFVDSDFREIHSWTLKTRESFSTFRHLLRKHS